MDGCLWLPLLLAVLMGTLAFTRAGATYYMDTLAGCSPSTFTRLGPGQKVTVRGKSSLFSVRTRQRVCTLTFQSSTGFEVDFDAGKIRNCDITLSLHSGKSGAAPTFQSYSCNDRFVRHDQYFSHEYITLKLTRNDLQTRSYEFEVDIKGRSSIYNNNGFYVHGLGNLSAWVIACIVISVIVSLLCCILLPVCLWCRVRRRRREADIPVVYTAPPPDYAGTYGRPVYYKQ